MKAEITCHDQEVPRHGESGRRGKSRATTPRRHPPSFPVSFRSRGTRIPPLALSLSGYRSSSLASFPSLAPVAGSLASRHLALDLFSRYRERKLDRRGGPSGGPSDEPRADPSIHRRFIVGSSSIHRRFIVDSSPLVPPLRIRGRESRQLISAAAISRIRHVDSRLVESRSIISASESARCGGCYFVCKYNPMLSAA